MAFKAKFEDMAYNTLPAGWVRLFSLTNSEVVMVKEGFKVLGTKQRRGLAHQAMSGQQDVDLTVRIVGKSRYKTGNINLGFGPMVRASGGIGTETCYSLTTRGNNETIELGKYVNGFYTELGQAGDMGSLYVAAIYLRLQVFGSSLKGKVWKAEDPEPNWQIEVEDTEIAGGQYNGVFMFDDDERAIVTEIRDYAEDSMITLSGNATTESGGQVNTVAIFGWPDGERVSTVTPAANGDWIAKAPPGEYGITYIADGCQPITHGPYLAEAE